MLDVACVANVGKCKLCGPLGLGEGRRGQGWQEAPRAGSPFLRTILKAHTACTSQRLQRRRTYIHRIITVLFFAIWATQLLACQVKDDAGQTLRLAHPAQRIISLAPDLTEIVFAAGAGNHLVGVIKGSDYPTEAKRISIVATFNSIDLEKIILLHPDLIIALKETRYLSSLKKLGIPIYLSQQRRLTDIPTTLEKIGCLAGTEQVAELAAKDYTTRYETLQKKYSHQKPLTVFYQLWPQPLITVNKNSWVNEIISFCHGKNIFADLKSAAPEINIEAVIVANPDVIIGTYSAQDPFKQWKKWPQLKAVQSQQWIILDPDLIERAGPRILDGVEELCDHFAIFVARNPLNY